MRNTLERRTLVRTAILVSVWALLYLPHLGLGELDDEEGRRAWVAREMLATGDCVEPRIFGRTYLAKPPLFPWMVALLARALARPVDELTLRLPSALATLATALLAAGLSVRLAAARARGTDSGSDSSFGPGLLGGLLFLCAPQVFAKGGFGELEASLAAFTFASLVWQQRGVAGRDAPSLPWLMLSGISLAAAILTKGPPAILFAVGGGVGALFAEPAARRKLGLAAWLPLLVGLVPGALWALALARRLGPELLLETWSGEVAGRGEPSIGEWLGERGDLVGGVVAGALPAVLVLALAWRRGGMGRWAGWTLAIGLGGLLLTPGVRGRYAYPLIPLLCALAGALASRQGSSGERARVLRALTGLTSVAALLATPLALLVALDVGGLAGRFGGPLDTAGWTAAGAASIVGALGIGVARSRGPRPVLLLGATCLALGSLRAVERFGLAPRFADRHGHRATARRLDEALDASFEPGAVLHNRRWGQFNELFYLAHEIAWAPTVEGVPAGGAVLLDARELEASGDLRELLRLPVQGRELALAERR